MAKECLFDDCSNPRFGGGYCSYHQGYRTDKKLKGINRTSKDKKTKRQFTGGRKPTGELKLFQEIWIERPHVCFVSGDKIKGFSVQCFAHVLPKGSYPSLRLNKDNIVLLTSANHYLYDHCKDQAKKLPMFDKLFELHDKSKRKYYDDNKIPKF